LPHVIFSNNLETGVYDIYSKLQKKNVPVKMITGDTQAIERQEIVDEYNQGKIDNLLLSRVGNEGINLLGTGTLFITTRHENEESANQTKARVVRYESHINSENKKVKIVDLISVFPTKDPTSQEKEEMGEYMSKCIDVSISGDKVVSELRDKMKNVNNITVEEHLNNLNKQKEAELKPIIEVMRNIGTKSWWTPPAPVVPKSPKEKKEKSTKRMKELKREIKSKMMSPSSKRKRSVQVQKRK
jgi:superfamily II DNA or RNA helicase